jgi:hypothetical protein
MSSDFMNSLAQNGEYRVNCFDSTNNYERLWKGVRNYKWNQVSSATSSTSLDGVNQYPTAWAGHHWGLTSGNNERDAVITSHSGDQWACAGNQGPRGEGAHAVVIVLPPNSNRLVHPHRLHWQRRQQQHAHLYVSFSGCFAFRLMLLPCVPTDVTSAGLR